MPHYVWKTNNESLCDLRELLREYIVDNDDKKMLLILGQPGIGKSTLITWIMANLVEKEDNIYVYQFASDLKDINWQGGNILNEILKTLNLGYKELENKSLILDGFDEINVSSDREIILNKLNQELAEMNILKRFSLIITCRENYVDISYIVKYDYIILQAWDEKQIRSFCEIYEKKSIGENLEYKNRKISEIKIEKILEKKEIFGIPLILYMVLALNVDIEKNSSIGSIYDQIFSLKGGTIYNRCYDKEHRINKPNIKECIYQISQRIAFWIFENNPEKAFIFQKDFKEICDTAMNKLEEEKKDDIQRDVLIGNYFKLIKHCEGVGTDELQFAHRSIYEYFVVVYFFESIYKMKSKEEVAGKLGGLLKYGHLTEQMLEFIKYKFDSIKKYSLPDITREIFTIMLRDGMTHYVEEKYMNIIVREMNIFSNMLDVVHLWNPKLGELDNIVFYLQHNYRNMLNLSGADLSGADLNGANLNGANLNGAGLCGANLSGTDLRRADLSRADLNGADLSGADLNGANLNGADLREASLNEVDLRKADLSGADLSGANLSEANLSGTDLRRVDLNGTNLNRANLREASLNEVDLREVYISGADLSGADLSGANLSGTDLRTVNISEANLRRANLSRVDLREVDLRETSLGRADLSRADLSRVDLRGVDLRGVDLRGTDLSGADLSGANLSGANLKGVNLIRVDLSKTYLIRADFKKTIFDKKQLDELCEKYDFSDSMVYISEIGEIVSYKEYCMGRK